MAQPAQTPSPQATQTEVGHEAGGHVNFGFVYEHVNYREIR